MIKVIPLLFLLLFACFSFSQSDTAREVKEIEHIFVSEAQPSFPGGEAKLFSFIKLVKHYPDSLKDKEIEGKVFIQFVVKKNGGISDVKVLRSPNTLFSQEAIRIVKLMPNWNPGRNLRGDSVDVRMVLPIIFDFSQNEAPKQFACFPRNAEYPGGNEALFEYLTKNVKFENFNTNNDIKTKFYFEFIVEKDGSLSNLKMLKNYDEEIYKHIIQIFNNMPKWEPAKQGGEFMRVKMVLPINITLK